MHPHQPPPQGGTLMLAVLLTTMLLLVGCDSGDGGPLLSDVRIVGLGVGQVAQVQVTGARETRTTRNALDFSYSVGREATVESYLEAGGQSYPVRPPQTRKPGTYQYHFDGVLPIAGEGGVVAQAVPTGTYTLLVKATTADGATVAQRSLEFRVVASDPAAPRFEQFRVAQPAIVSPNNDAISDTLQVSYRLTKDAEVLAFATDLTGTRNIVQPATEVVSGENVLYFNAKQQADPSRPLPDGPYTMTVRATDAVGNVAEQLVPLTVEGGGQAAAQIVKVEIGPRDIIRGDVNGGVISVSITVKNTGKATLQTHGPDPGYEYTTSQTYSSIGIDDQAGLWRVGLDWNNNRGDGPLRYPFRWGFGKPLLPGETVVVTGRVRILKEEQFMTFYAGLLQEGVQIINDRVGATEVEVH